MVGIVVLSSLVRKTRRDCRIDRLKQECIKLNVLNSLCCWKLTEKVRCFRIQRQSIGIPKLLAPNFTVIQWERLKQGIH